MSVTRRAGDVRGLRGGGAPVRRVFQYGILFAALIVAAEGLAGLLGIALRGFAASSRGSEVATPLALTVVGLPVFWLVGRWVWRGVSAVNAEREGRGWSLYVTVVLLSSVGTMIGTSFALAAWLVVGGAYNGSVLGHLVVWSAAWGLHWIAWRTARPARWPGFHLWIRCSSCRPQKERGPLAATPARCGPLFLWCPESPEIGPAGRRSPGTGASTDARPPQPSRSCSETSPPTGAQHRLPCPPGSLLKRIFPIPGVNPRAATSTDVAPSRTVAPPEPPGNTASSRFGGFLEAIETVPQVLIPGPGSGAREWSLLSRTRR